MITPAGKECPYYYEDYYRGRAQQECRLIAANPASKPWRPRDCSHCPVPDILRANASDDLVLKARVNTGVLGLIGVHVEVEAHCRKHEIPIEDPYVGCRLCNAEHPGVAEILGALDENGE
jgi:hypothetical protein